MLGLYLFVVVLFLVVLRLSLDDSDSNRYAKKELALKTQNSLDNMIYKKDPKTGEYLIPCSVPSCHKCEERNRNLAGLGG